VERQDKKRPKIHAKQKGFKNFFNFLPFMKMALRMEGFQKDFFLDHFSSSSILLSDPYSILNDG
jgi:hypothetical protein